MRKGGEAAVQPPGMACDRDLSWCRSLDIAMIMGALYHREQLFSGYMSPTIA
jgi:hypothetical protein